MPMIAPAKVRISPKAVRTVGSMTPVGGTMKAAMRRRTPKSTKATEVMSWSFISTLCLYLRLLIVIFSTFISGSTSRVATAA